MSIFLSGNRLLRGMDKMFYSATTKGFYDPAIHGNNIPADAVEITTEEYTDLLDGQVGGKQIVPDENGRPILVNPVVDLVAQRITEIKIELAELDQRRIRPLAEGDTDYLATLNAQAVELRAELQGLL